MRREGADTFRDALLECLEHYKHRAIALGRLQGISDDFQQEREQFLECHARRYVLDHMLAGLGWKIPTHKELASHAQNLQVETGVMSLMTGHRRFLDYFGFEKHSESPLLVVEAKRPSLDLPANGGGETHFSSHPASALFAGYLQARHASREASDKLKSILTEEWRGYLDDLRDYIRSVANAIATPRRAIITNGEWLVLFHNPVEAFVDDHSDVAPTAILIFNSRDVIVTYCSEIFAQLSYACLADNAGIVHPRQLPSLVSAEDVSYAMFGQRVLYCRDRKLYAHIPRIELTPLVHICTNAGGFVSVESANRCAFELGLSKDDQIDAQRDAIAQSAQELKQEIEEALGIQAIDLRDIKDHYEDDNAFQNLPGVRPTSDASYTSQEFVLVTGPSPHFLTDPTAYKACPFHDSAVTHKQGVMHEIGPLFDPMIDPRAFFPSGSCFHCAHHQTYESKTISLTATSRPRAGQRSGEDNAPFCELFQLDQVLCCQSCAFHDCCSKSELYHLPCP